MNGENLVHPTAKVYKDVFLRDSVLEANSLVADNCTLIETQMGEHSEFGRRCTVVRTQIGRGSFVGSNAVIKNATIGNYCSISWNVSIGGKNHNLQSASLYDNYWWNRVFGEMPQREEMIRGVTIGSDVWVGNGAIILDGVTIGDGAVIGAGAIVTKDVPPYAVMIGAPAVVHRYRFSEEICRRLLALQWWTWSKEKIKACIPLLSAPVNEQTIKQLEAYQVKAE